jgi:hypothetical protein
MDSSSAPPSRSCTLATVTMVCSNTPQLVDQDVAFLALDQLNRHWSHADRSTALFVRRRQPVLSTYITPLTTSHRLTVRLAPPRLAGGGSTSTHS